MNSEPWVNPDRGRIADRLTGNFQGPDHILAAVAEPWIDLRREREKVSTTVSTRILRSVATWSWTKSIAQTWLPRVASVRSSRTWATAVPSSAWRRMKAICA